MNQLDFRIHQALTGHILRHRQTAYLGVTAAQILIIIGLWSAYSHLILLLWFLLLQVVALPHFLICRRYEGQVLAPEQVAYIKLLFIGYALTNSMLWGALPRLMTETWDIHAFIILLPVLGIFAGAINLAAIQSIYFCGVIPILAQSLAALLFTDAANPVLAGLFCIYYTAMIKLAIELNKMLVRVYSMQFELESTNSELVIQKQAAEKANIDKSRFLAAASHDLRQPLYAMELFLGGLTQNQDSDNKAYLLSRMRNALNSMQKMFASLLDMSRFDAGVIKPVRQNYSANRLLQTLKMKVDDECGKKGIRLIVRSSVHWFYSDPLLIQRVLENYLSNAVKYTDSGGILVSCRKRKDCIRFEVWDTGRGIKKEDVDVIYDAFYQLNNPERDRQKGVGLGLSIVDQIANLLGTPIFVCSQYGQGSVFSIEVPIGEIEKESLQDSNSSELIDKEIFADLVVWIVDDDVDILEGLQLLLETWGCITRTFEMPEQVQALMEKSVESPNILISDLRLRDHRSGIEVIGMVSDQKSEEIPAIIITGDTGPAELQED